ncbi:hypothetical protein Dsin_029794 [Dipteronia sinensis]|uniref:Uncharacterized protein n=1 Tax=Dipteronia sinensis TaxID=43782 RepID=A0AAD9ZT97_9ROSI|nr:hypothetical protein Dsin_029794 [Dipteronia sinensis]
MVDILRKRSKGYKVAEEERLYLGFLKGKEGCSMDIFSDDCLLGALAKEKHKNFEDYQEDTKVEDKMPIATGHELEELQAELEGRNILQINHPTGPFGTKNMRMSSIVSIALVCVAGIRYIIKCASLKTEDTFDMSLTMEYARLKINYNGQWDKSTYGFYNYKGGSSKGMRTVIPQIDVTLVKKVDQFLRCANVHDVQPHVPPTQVKPTHFASASEGNQVSGLVSAAQPSQCTSTVQSTEIGEGCPTYYNDDPALSHFDQESSDGVRTMIFSPIWNMVVVLIA